ncbi:MAG: virulence factor family protein, partial [Rhizobium rhizophilum]
MKNLLRSAALLLTLLTSIGSATLARADDPPLATGMIPAPLMLLPDGDPKALVVLLSDAKGWQPSDQTEAERLQTDGAIVVGID